MLLSGGELSLFLVYGILFFYAYFSMISPLLSSILILLPRLPIRFVNVGETTESAVLREAEEETGIIIPLEQANSAMKLIGVYSDPRRDNRRAIVSIAYALEFIPSATTTKDGTSIPKAGDDAKEVISVPLAEIGVKYKGEDWYADHLTILLDFKEQMVKDGSVVREEELYEDVARSTCSSIS